MRLISSGYEVELVDAIDRDVTVRVISQGSLAVVRPTDLSMSPTEWGVLSNLGGTENLTRWYGYDIGTNTVVEVVPGG
jgi:hypothetical protein